MPLGVTSDLQGRVRDFVARHDLDAAAPDRLLDLVSEVGELAKEHLRATRYGRASFTPTAAWRDELGDVLFSVVALADATGVDAKRALEAAMAKYETRLRTRGDAGSGG